MKKKSIKTLLTTALAVCTIMTSTLPAMAADVEVTGNGESKSQTVEVSAEVNSLYSVTLPAVIELTRQDAVVSSSIEFKKSGFWHDFKIGAAGKLLSNHTLVARMEDCVIQGNEVWDQAYLKVYFYDSISGGTAKKLSDFPQNSDNYPKWTNTEIGSCDYDGTSLTNCEYNYKNFWIGVPEEELTASGAYTGSMVVNFTLE